MGHALRSHPAQIGFPQRYPLTFANEKLKRINNFNIVQTTIRLEF
jgi:hypothetical protein